MSSLTLGLCLYIQYNTPDYDVVHGALDSFGFVHKYFMNELLVSIINN